MEVKGKHFTASFRQNIKVQKDFLRELETTFAPTITQLLQNIINVFYNQIL